MAELDAEEQRLLKGYELQGANWKQEEDAAVPDGSLFLKQTTCYWEGLSANPFLWSSSKPMHWPKRTRVQTRRNFNSSILLSVAMGTGSTGRVDHPRQELTMRNSLF